MRAPRQLTLAGTVTTSVVGRAWMRAQRHAQHGQSSEDTFALVVKASGLPAIRRRFLFARQVLGRKWEADFAYPEYRLLIEIDGGIWRRGGGAHSHPSAILRDIDKANDAAYLGYHVLRFTTDHVRHGHAIRYLTQVLESRGWQKEHSR